MALFSTSHQDMMLHRSKQQDDSTLTKLDASTTSEGHKPNSKVPRRRSSALRFFASNSPPKHETHVHSQKEWEADYLKSLRANRPARPGGSRPLPARNIATPEPYIRAASALSFRPSYPTLEPDETKSALQDRSASALSHRRARSDMPKAEEGNSPHGRALVQPPHKRRSTRNFSGATTSTEASSTKPPLAYRESGMRWVEKQEARSLREALEDMDMWEESKVHAAAQDEASELVWRHLNEHSQDRLAKPRRNYKEHLEKGAHARSQTQGWYDGLNKLDGTVVSSSDTAVDNSSSCDGQGHESEGNARMDAVSAGISKRHEIRCEGPGTHIKWDSPEKKAYTNMAYQVPSIKSARRRSSGAKARGVSGGPFLNPDDKIYEEREEHRKDFVHIAPRSSRIPAPLTSKPRNSSINSQTSAQRPLPVSKGPADPSNRIYRSEIYKNPPSQSRNPSYIKNDHPSVSVKINDEPKDDRPDEEPRNSEGIEIRSDDIRAATSMRLKDRSPKLPTPSFVSDKPGRHIVSFDKDWEPKESLEQKEARGTGSTDETAKSHFKPPMPASTASAPTVPTINLPAAPSIAIDAPFEDKPIPLISVSNATVPSISLPDEPKTRPLPARGTHSTPANRPLPHHSSTTPVQTSTPHWTPANHRATAQCAACALPISGRIVSAASNRFHPHCFTCHHCSEPLECVAFYPEPDNKRAERIARIQSRLDTPELLEDKAGETAADDGDDSLRFYCHLDFHELFSPRCRSCKTPIETEVIVACGGSWHVGHFFCAECGDPFDAKTPFVEKDGYAWCVGCHAGRFSGKCKGCRKPVVEQGISALGAEWHEQCFICVVSEDFASMVHLTDVSLQECGAGFPDGRFFTRVDEQKPVCVGCEEKRLKA